MIWTASFSGEPQIFLVQNLDDSLSIYTTNPGPVLIATSAPGVLVMGAWNYIEVAADLAAALCTVTVTDAAGVAVQVIDAAGFSPGSTLIDSFALVGPNSPAFGWVADFYYGNGQAGDVTTLLGAPKIYCAVPQVDGDQFIGGFDPPQTIPFPGTAAPWWSQVDAIPDNPGSYIFRNQVNGGFPALAQGFYVDASAIPAGSTIAGVGASIMYAFAADTAPDHLATNESLPGDWTNGADRNYNVNAGQPDVAIDIDGAPLPFAFWVCASTTDPGGNPFVLSGFSDGTYQFGPSVGQYS